MITRLKGQPGCVASFLAALKRPAAFYGPLNAVGGPAVLAKAPEGYSEFGAPSPRAVEYCVSGAGKYAKRLDPPYTLDELIQALPERLRGEARESLCLRRAFFLSRVDVAPVKKSLVVAEDALLFLSLEGYMPLYTTEDLPADDEERVECGMDPPPPLELAEVELPVIPPEAFVDRLYVRDFWRIFTMRALTKLIWKVIRRI